MHEQGKRWRGSAVTGAQKDRSQLLYVPRSTGPNQTVTASSLALTCDADVVAEDEPAGGRHQAAHHHREGDLAAVASARAAAAAAQRDYSPAVHLR